VCKVAVFEYTTSAKSQRSKFKAKGDILFLSFKEIAVTLYNTGALMCINSSLTNAQIIMS